MLSYYVCVRVCTKFCILLSCHENVDRKTIDQSEILAETKKHVKNIVERNKSNFVFPLRMSKSIMQITKTRTKTRNFKLEWKKFIYLLKISQFGITFLIFISQYDISNLIFRQFLKKFCSMNIFCWISKFMILYFSFLTCTIFLT